VDNAAPIPVAAAPLPRRARASAPSRETAGAAWLRVAERGSLLGIWVMVAIGRLLGRRVARLLVHPVVLYFITFSPKARRASRDYLARLGQPHGLGAGYGHYLRFAHCTLDRLYWSLGKTTSFVVNRSGSEHLAGLAEKRRGALLIGAHMGSFEAMRAMAHHRALPMNIVGYFKNALLLNGILDKLNPAIATRFISVEPSVDFMLKLKERIDAGELVALLGDRVGLGDRVVDVDLFGGRVSLPTGPYWLAASLRCPVYLTFGLYHEPNRYDLYCEPFAEIIELPRGGRQEGARAYAQRFASRLEHYCRLAPDNWFNFYPYWKEAA
jgi:predicted LPLAT superfamily acyltransferase